MCARASPVQENGSVTIYKIATEAGVSISTVSRVINQKGPVSLKTKNKIEKVIQKYSYSPSLTARSMVNKKSNTVGILIPEIRNAFFSLLIGYIDKILFKNGYSMLLYNCEFSTGRELTAINDLISRNADGLILLSSGADGGSIANLIRNRISVVTLHSNLSGADTINIMNRQAFFDVTEHLIQKGHRDIAFVGSDIHVSLHQTERMNGYSDALKKYGITPRKELALAFYESSGNENSIIDETKKILHLKRPPSAIITANDYTAINVYQAVSGLGMKVGADIAVTGFDNTPISGLICPSLTTVDIPTRLIAEIVTDFLLKRMLNNDRSEPKEVLIPGKLIIRDSSAKNFA